MLLLVVDSNSGAPFVVILVAAAVVARAVAVTPIFELGIPQEIVCLF